MQLKFKAINPKTKKEIKKFHLQYENNDVRWLFNQDDALYCDVNSDGTFGSERIILLQLVCTTPDGKEIYGGLNGANGDKVLIETNEFKAIGHVVYQEDFSRFAVKCTGARPIYGYIYYPIEIKSILKLELIEGKGDSNA